MDGVIKDTFAHFHVGNFGILKGSSLQRVCWGEDCCKVLRCWRRKVNGHFSVKEKRVANGGNNCVAQEFRLGELCKGRGSFGSAEGGCYAQEVTHAESGGNACPPHEGARRFSGIHAGRCGNAEGGILLVAQGAGGGGYLFLEIIHSRGVVVSKG